MKELWAISEARTRISLPFGASSDVLPLSDADALSLSTRFPNEDTLIHTRDSAAAEIVNDRRRTVVDETAQRVLAVLLMRREMTVGELLTESGLLVTLAPVPRRLWGRMESWCAIVNRAVL